MLRKSHNNDLELAALLQSGDRNAFQAIYKKFWKRMLLVAWNHTKNKELSEDIVHEVFIILWEKRDQICIDNLAGFLATAVKFRVFKHFRKESNRQKISDSIIQPELSEDAESKLDVLFLEEYLNSVVQNLPPKCRLVFEYSRFNGLKNFEIAKIMKITEKGVEANLTRALKILREALKSNGLHFFL